MPGDHPPQRLRVLLQPGPGLEPQHQRLQVHIGAVLPGQQVVEEHALLQRRQRVDVGHVRRPALDPRDRPPDLLRVQPDQRQHLRGDPRGPGRDQVRRHLRRPPRPPRPARPGSAPRTAPAPPPVRRAPAAAPPAVAASRSSRQQRGQPGRGRGSNTARTGTSARARPGSGTPAAPPAASARPGRRSRRRGRPGPRPSTSANRSHRLFLGGRGRGPARPGRGVVRGGQRGPVQLARRGQRQRVQHHHRRGHHVVGQPGGGVLAHRRGQRGSPVAVASGRGRVPPASASPSSSAGTM